MDFWRWVGRLTGGRPAVAGEGWAEIPEGQWPGVRARWAAMPHRRLTAPPHHDFDPRWERAYGPLATTTIALAPPEHGHWLFTAIDATTCPICGRKADHRDGVPATMSPVWGNGMSIGFPAWVHPACFDALPDAETPARVPW